MTPALPYTRDTSARSRFPGAAKDWDAILASLPFDPANAPSVVSGERTLEYTVRVLDLSDVRKAMERGAAHDRARHDALAQYRDAKAALAALREDMALAFHSELPSGKCPEPTSADVTRWAKARDLVAFHEDVRNVTPNGLGLTSTRWSQVAGVDTFGQVSPKVAAQVLALGWSLIAEEQARDALGLRGTRSVKGLNVCAQVTGGRPASPGTSWAEARRKANDQDALAVVRALAAYAAEWGQGPLLTQVTARLRAHLEAA